MTSNSQTILAILVTYHSCLILLGLWAARRAQTNEDFLIGGRNLNGWVAGFSYAATSSSAWVLMGFSGFVYATGLSALWMLPGIWGGYIVAWVVLGKQLQLRAHQHKYVTFTDFIAADTVSHARRRIVLASSAMILFCFIFYISAQLLASGSAMKTYFDIPSWQGILLAALIVGVYSVLGGFWAVSTTDMIQGIVILVIAILLPLAALVEAGGPVELWARLAQDTPGHLDIFGGRAGLTAIGAALGMAGIGLGTFGQPQLMTRIMSVKNDKERRKAFKIAMSWSLIVFSGMALLGLSARVLPVSMDNAEQILFGTTSLLFPDIIAGLVMAALLSAVMSTVDSILVASSASISHDIKFQPVRSVLMSRIAAAGLMVLAVGISLSAPTSIFERVLFAWTALGAAFGPVLLARLAGWRPHPNAVFLAMMTGFFVSVAFNQYLYAGPSNLYERIGPWICPLLLLYAWRLEAPAEQHDG